MARPSKYETHVKPRLNEITAWARDGATEEEIARRLHISVASLFSYKKEFLEFLEALTHARAYDEEVVSALHLNTVGQVVKLQKPIKCKKKFFENGKLVREEEVIVTAEEEIYVHPDTMAQMYWLNNRLPTKWKAK
ncbi:MAG: transposase, partial [Clostridia bacterium]|nr:transposase [Clostridia bacterium]